MTSKLLTPEEVAARLQCSKKTLAGYVAYGAIRYIQIGHGPKRPRKRFTEEDVEIFIANQARREATPTRDSRARGKGSRSGDGKQVISFTALRAGLRTTNRNAERGTDDKR